MAGWDAAYVTPDWETFKEVFWRSQFCLAIVDEFGERCKFDRKEAGRMLTRGRHVDPSTKGGGHVVCAINQSWMGIDKDARAQFSRLYAFNQADKYGDLVQDWNDKALFAVETLPKFHYIRKDRMGEAVRGVTHP